MPKGMQPIATYNVGAGGTTYFNWHTIPQNYTDLMLLISIRSSGNIGNRPIGVYFNFTGYPGPTNHQYGTGTGTGTSVTSLSAFMAFGAVNDTAHTSGIFSSHKIYIPNYTSTTFKQVMFESVAENNGAASTQQFGTNLWKQNYPVTSMQFDLSGDTMLQHSSFTLYGISR